MARIPLATPDSEPEAFALLRAKRSHAPNAEIFRTIAICPEILEAFIPMADAVRKGYGIDPKLREMAIVMTCQTLGTSYEHNPHWNRAIKEGVPREKMLALWEFEQSEIFSPLEKAVLRLARDATRSPGQVSVEVWEAVHDELGSQQALALLFSIGWYNMTGRITGPLDLHDEAAFARL